MTPATQASSLDVPSEVYAFAIAQGAGAYLPAVLEMTHRVFPGSRRLAVSLEDDPEIPNDRHIVLEVDAPLDVPEALEAHWRWNDGLFACCPAPLLCLFRLSIDTAVRPGYSKPYWVQSST